MYVYFLDDFSGPNQLTQQDPVFFFLFFFNFSFDANENCLALDYFGLGIIQVINAILFILIDINEDSNVHFPH